MPSEKSRYEPVPPIPSYDEATADDASSSSGSFFPPLPRPLNFRSDFEGGDSSLVSFERELRRLEELNRELLRRGCLANRPSWSLEYEAGDTDEEREMQDLEIEDPLNGSTSNSSFWTKRIGFSRFLLPRWQWRWRLPRLTVRLPRQSDNANNERPGSEQSETRTRWGLPTIPMTRRDVLILFGRLLALTLVLGTIYILFVSDLFINVSNRLNGQMFDPDAVRQFVQMRVDTEQIKESLRHLTSFAHLAGTEGDYALAMDVHNSFIKNGFDQVVVDEYYVYLNYPKKGGRAVEIMSPDGKNVTWAALLEERDIGGEIAGRQTYAFHGHSKSGDVRGPLIYANYGSRDDFKSLADKGIDTKDAIALVRYDGTQRNVGLKVKAAEMAGFAGCILYSDPADDGFIKGEPAPKGRFMPADAVRRDTVSLTNWVIGDVLTPGWGSIEGQPFMDQEQSKTLVQIPSLPIAWRDAQSLLQQIQGFGEPCPDAWRGGVPDVAWWSGNSSSPIVHLKNEQDENPRQKIWNIYSKISGLEQGEKSIIIGNHRDSWAFGATDPNSGTAIMLEVARVFGELVARGWRPLRSIEFMSWDAEEYNIIGSTEFVEKNLEILQQQAFAYINLDGAVSGREFHAAGSPMFRKLITKVIEAVSDPVANTTLLALWKDRNADLESLGSGSDYVPFQDIAGTSSIDIRFGGEAHPLHSSYDNFQWMQSVSDPAFIYHGLLGQVLGLLALELADRPILPFDMGNYANSLGRYLGDLWQWADSKGITQGEDRKINLEPLQQAVKQVGEAVSQFEKWEPYWEQNVIAANGWEPAGLGVRRLEYNNRMSAFETGLLDLEPSGGIPNRTQFKHVVFGPQLWDEVDEAYFPAIRDVIETEDWPLAQSIIDKTAKIITDAAATLVAT